jgi:hypothetical protein
MVNEFRVFLRGIVPGCKPFENEEVECVDEPRIDDSAFEICGAFGNERRIYVGPATGVNPNSANLSTSRPEQLSMPTTFFANSTAGRAMTHSRVDRRAA